VGTPDIIEIPRLQPAWKTAYSTDMLKVNVFPSNLHGKYIVVDLKEYSGT